MAVKTDKCFPKGFCRIGYMKHDPILVCVSERTGKHGPKQVNLQRSSQNQATLVTAASKWE